MDNNYHPLLAAIIRCRRAVENQAADLNYIANALETVGNHTLASRLRTIGEVIEHAVNDVYDVHAESIQQEANEIDAAFHRTVSAALGASRQAPLSAGGGV